MKLSTSWDFLLRYFEVVKAAAGPTFRAIWQNPVLLFSPKTMSQLLMANVWLVIADGVDEGHKSTKQKLITENAHGVVLDIGAGYGHTANFLDRQRVTTYVALEPNKIMHPQIRAKANANGFKEEDGSLIITACGAQETSTILAVILLATSDAEPSDIVKMFPIPKPVDTIISVLTLCSVPSPQETITNLVNNVLKSDGKLLFIEHVRNPREDVAWWQSFWTPLWGLAFDGCRLDRQTDLWIERMEQWKTKDIWGIEEDEEDNMFLHRGGTLVKA